MSDSELWGPGGGTDDEADQGGSRVDELFTTAIERQVAEQRDLNRLLTEVEQSMSGLRGRIDELQEQVARDVAPTSDRLAALDATLRSLRETQSQQHVTLRSELQDAIDAFRQEATERGERLSGELANLRQAEASLGERLAEVTSTVSTALVRVDARQDDVAAELSLLTARLVEVAEAAATERDAVRSELSGFRAGLTSVVREVMAADAEEHRRLLDETLQRRLAEADERAGARGVRTATDLHQVTEEVGSELRQLRSRTDERLEELAASLQTGIQRELRSATDALQQAVAANHESLAEQAASIEDGFMEARSLLQTEIATIEAAMTGAEAARTAALEERFTGWREALEARLVVAADQQATAADQMRESLEEGLADVRSEISGQRTSLVEDLRAQHDGLAEELVSQRHIITTELADQGDAITVALVAQRETLAQHVEPLAEAADEQRRQGDVQIARIRALTDRLGDQVAARLDDVGDRISEQLEGQRAELRRLETAEQAAAGSADERLVQALGRVDELTAHLDRMERSLVGYLETRDERLARERELLLQDLVEQLAGGLTKRERRKLAAKLEVPDPPTPATPPATPATTEAPAAPTPPPATPPPAPTPPRKVAVRSSAPEKGGVPPARSAPARASQRKRKPAAKPAREASPREVLGRVKGVGPAKQSALLDEFGSLDAIRAASLDELAALKGIGPALAEAIKAGLDA